MVSAICSRRSCSEAIELDGERYDEVVSDRTVVSSN